MKSFLSTSLVLALSGFLTAGCTGGDGNDVSNVDSDASAAEKFLQNPEAFSRDEAAQFGDLEISSLDEEEALYSDPYASADSSSTSLIVAQETDSSCDTYFMRVRWGQFIDDDDRPGAFTDWSGTLSVNAGTLELRRTVRFDSQDSIVDRSDPKLISFVSKTLPHFDGLRVKYVVCASDTALLAAGEVPTVTFDSPLVPFSKSYSVDDLKFINDLVENVDANGNSFQFQSTLKTDLCQGTISGHWYSSGLGFGLIKGIVISSNGVRMGHIKGVVGSPDSEGVEDWAAKFIFRNGRYKGYLKGTAHDGTFEGTAYGRDRQTTGSVSGTYVEGNRENRGTFSGDYTLDCALADEAVEVARE